MQYPLNIIVIKLDHKGKEVWRYSGHLIEQGRDFITIEAFFDRSDIDFHGMILGFGDRFIETYYFDRWYNIFEIHAKEDDHLKGWYCNISYPAEFQGNIISYRDLALDLLVFPDGSQIILDEDEFKSINLDRVKRRKANAALSELQTSFQMKKAGQ